MFESELITLQSRHFCLSSLKRPCRVRFLVDLLDVGGLEDGKWARKCIHESIKGW